MVKKRIFAVGGICAVGADITNNNMTHSVLTGGCAVGATILVHVTRCGDTFNQGIALQTHTCMHVHRHACTHIHTQTHLQLAPDKKRQLVSQHGSLWFSPGSHCSSSSTTKLPHKLCGLSVLRARISHEKLCPFTPLQ